MTCRTMNGRKERNILFNDTLSTFYLRLYGVKHMVKDHSESERGNPLLPHRLLFPISSKGSFICIIPQTYHSLCYTSRGALAGTRTVSGRSTTELHLALTYNIVKLNFFLFLRGKCDGSSDQSFIVDH